MKFRFIIASSLAWGCQVGDPDPDDGGQSGTAIPDGCYEDHRTTVTDPSLPPEGFDQSADEAIAELAGTWTGSGEVDGTAATVTFDVAHDGGPIEAVYFEYHQASGGSEAMGAPSSTTPLDCPPSYAFGVVTSLDLSPWVSGEGAGQTHQDMVGNTWFTAETPLDEVAGTLTPSFDTGDWDRTELAATFTHAEDDVRLEVSWWGINDLEENPPPAATGTVSTTTVEPSGVTEPIASFSGLTRE